jgi:hypothetical protein
VFEAALIQAYGSRVSTSSRRPNSKTDWKYGIAKLGAEHLLKAKRQSRISFVAEFQELLYARRRGDLGRQWSKVPLFILAPRIRNAETVRRAVCFSQIGLRYSQILLLLGTHQQLAENVCGLHIKHRQRT